MKTKVVLNMFLFILGFSLNIQFAEAIEYGQMGGRPTNYDPNVPDSQSWFIYKLDPGTAKEDSLTVANLFEDSWVAVIYAADSIKSSSGGFALRQLTEPKEKVGSWVKFYPEAKPDFAGKIFEDKKTIDEVCKVSGEDLQKNYELDQDKIAELGKWCEGKDLVEIELKSGEKKELLFVISIPKDADVGEHTGGILIQKKSKEEAAQGDGSKVLLTTRVGVRIYETVPGEIIKALAFSDFKIDKNFSEFYLPWDKIKKDKFGEYMITSVIKNSGNASTDFNEQITINNIITRKKETMEVREFQVLRGDEFISSLAWKAPRLAYLSFQKEYRYKKSNGEEEIIKSELIKKLFIPWREMMIFTFFALVAVGVYAIWRRYQRKHFGGEGWVDYVVGENETIQTLSNQFKINWKVLAKTNKLKAPFMLEKGQVIKVPNIGLANQKVENILTTPDNVDNKPKPKTKAVAAENDLTDEDILNRKELFDGIVKDEKKEDSGSDLDKDTDGYEDKKRDMIKTEKSAPKDTVDSSLFFATDGHKKEGVDLKKGEIEKNIQSLEKNKNIAVSPQPLKKGIDQNFKKVTTEEILDNKEIEKSQSLIVENGDIKIRGDKDDSKSYFKVVILVLGVVIVLLLIAVVYLLLSNKKSKEVIIQQMPVVVEDKGSEPAQENVAEMDKKEEPVKEEEPIDPLKMTIEVYNASGVVGAAGKVKDFLVSKKYESVEAKNYPGDEVTGSTIYYKEERIKEEAQWLADMLKDSDIQAEVKLATTEEEKTAEVVIILGK